MQKKTKLKWETPKLIILVRGKPEEAVLAGCKTITLGTTPLGPSRVVNMNGCVHATNNLLDCNIFTGS